MERSTILSGYLSQTRKKKTSNNGLDVFSIALTAINNPVAPWMVSIHPCSKAKQVD